MKLSQVDLNLLVVLEAILAERSVTGAGRRVGLSQSATSGALKRLRDMFDDPLLERVGARWRLTPLAIELNEPLQQILVAIDDTVNRRSRFDPTTTRRQFRIAAADDVRCVLLQPVLERLAQLAPNARVLITRPDAETAHRLASRQLDLSIEPQGRYRAQGFASERIYKEPWAVAVWAGNAEIKHSITQEQFMALGHVTVSVPPYAFTLVDRAVGVLSQKLDVQVVSDSFMGLTMLLRGTSRIALVPAIFAAKFSEVAEIRVLPPPIPVHDLVFAMAWPALYTRDEGHAFLRKVIVDVASELDESCVFAEAM